MKASAQRRVAITGVGVLSGEAHGRTAFWDLLCRPDPPPIPSRVEGFDPLEWMSFKQARRSDPFAHLAVAAAKMAVEDAGGLPAEPERVGVVYGTGIAATATMCRDYSAYVADGSVDLLSGARTMTNASAANISFVLGLGGHCDAVSSGCASGTHAIADGARLVFDGRCDAAIVGGSEAVLYDDPRREGFSTAGLRALWVHSDDPDTMRPFDRERSGFLLSDGAAALVLEDLEAARARGATVYAEVVGTANTVDLHDLIKPNPTGEGARRCIEAALDDAGATGDEVRHVNAHGTGTPVNDLAEARAIRDTCGTPGPAVNGIKGITGHTGAAAGAIEAVAVALSIHERLIPATAGLDDPDPEVADLDLVVGEARSWEPGLSLSLSMGLGGHTGVLALAPAD